MSVSSFRSDDYTLSSALVDVAHGHRHSGSSFQLAISREIERTEQLVAECLSDRYRLSEELRAEWDQNNELQEHLDDRCTSRAFMQPPGGETTVTEQLLLDTMSLCADANTRLRIKLCQSYIRKKEIAIECSRLSPDDQKRLKKQVSGSIFSRVFDSHEEGADFRLSPSSLMCQWQRVRKTDSPTLCAHKSLSGGVSASTHRRDPRETIAASLEANGTLYQSPKHRTQSNFSWGQFDPTQFTYCYGFPENPPREDYGFDEEDSPSNIVMDSDGSIKFATVEKIVERLTYADCSVTRRYAVILTHPTFTTSGELLRLLLNRYYMPWPPNISPDEMRKFQKDRLAQNQFKIFGVLKQWISDHWADDWCDNQPLIREVHDFATQTLQDGTPVARSLASQLLELLKRRQDSPLYSPRPSSSSIVQIPPRVKYNPRTFSLLNVNELDMARQLTIIDFKCFRDIPSREFLNQAWSKPNKEIAAPHICAMIDNWNRIKCWVQFEILSLPTIQQRATLLKKFLKIMEYLLDEKKASEKDAKTLNNFSSAFSIYTALKSNPIHRLKRTVEKIESKYMARYKQYEALFSTTANSKRFRQAMKTAQSPCVPYLGKICADLTFIEEGNKNTVNGMVNFHKRLKFAEQMKAVKQNQQAGYHLEEVPVIQDYLRRKLLIHGDEVLWEKSLEVEPKEPKE